MCAVYIKLVATPCVVCARFRSVGNKSILLEFYDVDNETPCGYEAPGIPVFRMRVLGIENADLALERRFLGRWYA